MTGRHAAPRPRARLGKTLAVISLAVAFTAGTSSALTYTVLRQNPLPDDRAAGSPTTTGDAQGLGVAYPGETGRPTHDTVTEPAVAPSRIAPATAGQTGTPAAAPSPIPTPAPAAESVANTAPTADAPASAPRPGLIAGDYLTREIAAYWPNDDIDSALIDDQAGISATLPAHLNEYLNTTTIEGYIVAMLGTLDLNDSVDQFQRDLDALTAQHPDQCIVWVTTHHMDYGFSGIPLNTLLRERAQDGLIMADWAEQVTTNSSLVTTDGRHVTAYSGPELARSVIQAASACPAN